MKNRSLEMKDALANLEIKDAGFELKLDNTDEGVISGYASLFDIADQGNDTVKKGAFIKSLNDGRPVKMLWQHDPSQPIGVWDEVKEDARGLFVKGRLLKDVSKANEILTLIKADAVNGLSIGYRTVNATKSDDGRGRDLNELHLWEVSVVTFPMLPEATVQAKQVKGKREFEKELRDVFNLSQKEAKALIADGWDGLQEARDVQPEVKNEDLKDLTATLTQLQETFNE